MIPDFDSSTAFYALGVVFGLFSIIYFGIEVILEISPVVKAGMLFVASLTFFSATGLSSSRWSDISLYFMASFSYLIFVAYTLLRFDFGSAGTFLMLAGSSAAFMIAGYIVSEKELTIPKEKSKYLVIAGVVILAGLFLFDVSGPQPEVELELRNSVNLTLNEETSLGTVKVSNDFVLPRGFEVPNYGACVTESGMDVNVYTERGGDTIDGKSEMEMELKAQVYGEMREEDNVTGVYSVVETEKCLRGDAQDQISVFER